MTAIHEQLDKYEQHRIDIFISYYNGYKDGIATGRWPVHTIPNNAESRAYWKGFGRGIKDFRKMLADVTKEI